MVRMRMMNMRLDGESCDSVQATTMDNLIILKQGHFWAFRFKGSFFSKTNSKLLILNLPANVDGNPPFGQCFPFRPEEGRVEGGW